MNQTNNLTREKMLEFIDEFHELYQTRPIKDNNGGMKSGHMFPFCYKNITTKIYYRKWGVERSWNLVF